MRRSSLLAAVLSVPFAVGAQAGNHAETTFQSFSLDFIDLRPSDGISQQAPTLMWTYSLDDAQGDALEGSSVDVGAFEVGGGSTYAYAELTADSLHAESRVDADAPLGPDATVRSVQSLYFTTHRNSETLTLAPHTALTFSGLAQVAAGGYGYSQVYLTCSGSDGGDTAVLNRLPAPGEGADSRWLSVSCANTGNRPIDVVVAAVVRGDSFATPVPEPASQTLWLAGLAALLPLVRRRGR